LFSMRGDQHKTHQQLLMSTLGPGRVAGFYQGIARGFAAFSDGLRPGAPISLLTEMRRLALNVAQRVIFGDGALETGRLIQSYFDCRRNLKSMQGRRAAEGRRELIRIGTRLDRMLRDRVTTLRNGSSSARGDMTCILAELMALDLADGERLSDDELVGHANVLFMSSSEPIAVALTWTLLLLSQHPRLRVALGHELMRVFGAAGVARQFAETDLPLLHATVRESLRLLPPNAIMVRLTTVAVNILGRELPANCEVVVSPFVAQRDPQDYADPDAFDPWRWRALKPSPYAYFPFGVGARYCMGRHLAGYTLAYVLACILDRFDVVLASDQDIDWKMDITMMPAREPIAKFLPWTPDQRIESGGRLGGPVSALVRFPSAAVPANGFTRVPASSV
jgi:cytochrome P450